MRLAVIADVHGNVLALDAVLADIGRQGVDKTVNLGDVVSGPLWPRETYERLATLGFPTVRGNHDRALCDPVAGLGPSNSYAVAQLRVAANPRSWERQAVRDLAADACKALATLPLTLEPLPGVVACHGTPTSDTTYFLEQVTDGALRLASVASIRQQLGSLTASLVLCGHTHVQRLVQIGGTLIVNPGSVGCPAYVDDSPPAHVCETGSPHARYAILDDQSGAWSVEHRAIAYDWAVASARAAANGRPEWAMALATGRVR